MASYGSSGPPDPSELSIRRARRGDQRAERELLHRLDSLQRGDPGAAWHAVT